METSASNEAWPEVAAPPSSSTARGAGDLCARVSPPFLFHHSQRKLAWACLLAQMDGIVFDREFLYVACLLHDLGLTSRYAGPRCFEVESAQAAAEYARARGWSEERVSRLAETITLHMQPQVELEDGAEAYLLALATGCDVSGHRAADLDPDLKTQVLALAPRTDFASGFTALFEGKAKRRPDCMAGVYMRGGLATRIAEASFGA
jgi:hypothetical protein